MNIKEIIELVNSPISDKLKEELLVTLIAKDENAINAILQILDAERRQKKELLLDMNLELSRAHTYIEDYATETKKIAKLNFNKDFVLKEVADFYKKYKGVISHCFNKFN